MSSHKIDAKDWAFEGNRPNSMPAKKAQNPQQLRAERKMLQGVFARDLAQAGQNLGR
jgi:hypothetical protein